MKIASDWVFAEASSGRRAFIAAVVGIAKVNVRAAVVGPGGGGGDVDVELGVDVGVAVTAGNGLTLLPVQLPRNAATQATARKRRFIIPEIPHSAKPVLPQTFFALEK
jgi:hypothetical protein